MREEIYQRFNPIGKEDLKYIKKLNIANHSYDYEKRKEMLSRWATTMNCKWFQDANLKVEVLKYIENEAKLPTPLNIKDFVMETIQNTNTNNVEDLLQLVNKQSRRTAERFARDIIGMEEREEIDKVLFLLFPFISDSFSIDFVKAKYQELIKDQELINQLKIKGVKSGEQ